MDVSASSRMERISLNDLDLLQVAAIVVVSDHIAAQLSQDIHEPAVF